jgi:hypothetical protein
MGRNKGIVRYIVKRVNLEDKPWDTNSRPAATPSFVDDETMNVPLKTQP